MVVLGALRSYLSPNHRLRDNAPKEGGADGQPDRVPVDGVALRAQISNDRQRLVDFFRQIE
jgi:hypothetical protein